MHHLFPYQSSYQSQEIVLNQDERTSVKNSRKAPFRWICSIEVEFPEPVIYPLGTLEHPGKSWATLIPSRQGCGSGILISPRHVLTASHVIAGLKVIRKRGKDVFRLVKAHKIRVIPGRNEQDHFQTRPYGSYPVQNVQVSSGFRRSLEVPVRQLSKQQVRRALSSDFGLISLRAVPGAKGGIFPGLTAGWWSEDPQFQIQPAEQVLAGTPPWPAVRIGGYPGEKGPAPCTTPWYAQDKIIRFFPQKNKRRENLIFYQADTSAGMSGSPVWIKKSDGRYYLVAVHSSFLSIKNKGRFQTLNVGTLLSSKVIRQLNQWGASYQEIIFSKPFRW